MLSAAVEASNTSQLQASLSLLAESQNVRFPYQLNICGHEIIVEKGVFSPLHFHGWEVFTENFPSTVGQSVLEIGCGSGVTSIALAGRGARRVLAVDISEAAVRNTGANVLHNSLTNVEVRRSDVYSAIEPDEHFDTIYWNLPFIYVPPNYRVSSVLELSLVDPGYSATERYLSEAQQHLAAGGQLVAGLGDFADLPHFMKLAAKYRFTPRLLARERRLEVNTVEFQLWCLTR